MVRINGMCMLDGVAGTILLESELRVYIAN